jgi:hypothetical protein
MLLTSARQYIVYPVFYDTSPDATVDARPLLPGESISLRSDGNTSAVIILDYGHNVAGYPTFTVEQLSGDTSLFQMSYSEGRDSLDLYFVSILLVVAWLPSSPKSTPRLAQTAVAAAAAVFSKRLVANCSHPMEHWRFHLRPSTLVLRRRYHRIPAATTSTPRSMPTTAQRLNTYCSRFGPRWQIEATSTIPARFGKS